jgi:hypothetical protein
MTTILINTISCNSDYIVYLSNTYSVGTYVTLQDNGSNASFFTSNSIVIRITSGYTFYDGSDVQYIRRSGDSLTLVALTSSMRLVNTEAYVTSGNAFLSNASTTNMFIYGGVSLSNITTNSLTATGGIDLKNPPTIEGIPSVTTVNLNSTVAGLGTLGYLSSVSFMNFVFASTVTGLGGYGYISISQLISTVGGLGSAPGSYISSTQLTSTFRELGNYYISTPSLTSTVGGLGTYGYISTSWLASTVVGLGSLPFGYISTAQLFSTVSNVLLITASNNNSTFANLGGIYISSASLVSTIQGISTIYVTPTQLASTTSGLSSNYVDFANSTVKGLGNVKYISSLSLFSTVTGLGTYGYISIPHLVSTTSNSFLINKSNLVSTVTNLGNFYISTGGLLSTTSGISNATQTILTSTVAGLGSLPFSLVSSLSLQSTVAGLGTYRYISLAHLFSTTSNLSLFLSNVTTSTITGLGSLGYISTAQLISTVIGFSNRNTSNLISTVNTLGLTYISSGGLQSTVAGLATYGMISLSQLMSTTSNILANSVSANNSTIAGLGNLGYISTAQVFSTVKGFTDMNNSNFKSTIDTLGYFPGYISSKTLESTVAGLGTYGYISLSQLTSTTTGMNLRVNTATSSTINGLGSSGYISISQIVSTVTGFSNTTRSSLISTVNTLDYIYTTQLASTQTGLGTFATKVQVDQAQIDLSNMQNTAYTSTIDGLGNLNYISTAQVVSTFIGINLINTANMTSTTNTLGSSVPGYISTAQLVSTYTGIINVELISISSLRSTTSNLQTLNYGITATLAGLGSAPGNYISTAQLVSTVLGFSNTTRASLITTVNTLSTLPLVTTVYDGIWFYYSITYTRSLIIYGFRNIYTNNYSGTAETTLYEGQNFIFGLACDGNNVYAAGGTQLLSVSLATGIATPLASTYSFTNLQGGGLCLDSTFSNLYICDNGAGRLLRYSFSTQIITTVANIDGIAKIAIDSSDTFAYVTNYTNRIFKVFFDNRPTDEYILPISASGICLDLTKSVAYIIQYNGNTIYQLDLTTYSTTAIAGNGSATFQNGALLNSSFDSPYDLIFNVNDSSIYVADSYNRMIRKITLNTFSYISSLSLQSTVAGLGKTYISAPHLVSTTLGLSPPTVRPDSMTNAVNTLAGTLPLVTSLYQGTEFYTSITYTRSLIIYADSRIYTNNYAGTNHVILYNSNVYIYGLACDGNNVYAASAGNQLLSVSLATGIATPLASTYSFTNLREGGLCLDSTFSNLYICDNGAGRLLRYSFSTQMITTVANIVGIAKIAIDSSDTFAYVTNYANRIFKVFFDNSPTVEYILPIFASGICVDIPKSVAYIIQYNGNTIYQIDLTTYSTTAIAGNGSAALQNGALLNSSFNGPYDLIFNVNDSSIYVADTFNRAIRKITLKTFSYISSFSLQSSVAGLGSVPFSYISTLSLTSTVACLGSFGYLSTGYLVSTTVGSSNSMVPFTSTTAGLGSAGYISTSALSNIVPDVYSVTTFASVVSPEAIAITSNFIFYTGGNNIYRNTFDGKQQTIFYSSNAPFTMLACDLSNIYTVSSSGNQILSISMSTSLATVLANTPNQSGSIDGTDPSQVRFNRISAISIDPAYKFLYICEYNSYKFRRLELSNGTSLFNVTTLAFTYSEPISVAVDSFNQYAYLGTLGNGIYKYTLFQSNIPELLTSSLNKYGFSIDTRQNFLYASDRNTHNIFSVSFTPGTPTLLAGTGTAGYKDGNGSIAQFNTPTHSVYNPYDSCVYIADTGNSAIRKMTTTLYASTIAGLNASAVVKRIVASNSSVSYAQHALSSNFVTSASVLPSIPGLQLWLDGGDPLGNGIVLSNGTTISSWIDKSGNGFNATAIASPKYFNGSISNDSWGFNTNLNTNMPNQTVFAVYTTNSASTSQTIVGGRGSGGTSGDNAYIEVGLNGGSNQINLSYPARSFASFGTTYTTQLVQTFAGVFGSSGLINGRGSNARFSNPAGIVVDTLGNAYVAEFYNDVIRKITPDGTVSTYAGTGSAGSVDSTLLNSSFYGPLGLAIDSLNNLYVTDYLNYTIRRISSTNVTTVAGRVGISGTTNGPRSVATFDQPISITVDSFNNMYVAERRRHIIRRVTLGGTVSTYAGVQSTAGGYIDSIDIFSRFYTPLSVTCDSLNRIYVADLENLSIRMITTDLSRFDIAPYAVLSIINTPEGIYFTLRDGYSFNFDNVYYDSYSTVFHVPAGYPNAVAPYAKVYESDIGDQITESKCRLWGLAYNTSTGKMYASDSIAGVIYEVSPAENPGHCIIISGSFGAYTSVANQGAWRDGTSAAVPLYNRPRGIDIDPITNIIYIADTGNGIIRQLQAYPPYTSTLLYNIDGGTLNRDPGLPYNNLDFSNVKCVALLRPVFGLFLYVGYKTSIYLYNILNGQISIVAGSSTQSGYVDANGQSARFNSIVDIRFDADNRLFIADSEARIRRMDLSYNVTTAINTSSFSANIVSAVCPLHNNTLYLGADKIYLIGNTVITIGGNRTIPGYTDGDRTKSLFTRVVGLSWIQEGVNSYLYMTDGNKIRRMITNTATYMVSTVAGEGTMDTTGLNDGLTGSAKFNYPYGIAVFSNTIYITEYQKGTIRSISYVPDIVIGGNVTTNTTLFTSVVEKGVYNGVIGYQNGIQVSRGSILLPFIHPGTVVIGSTYNSAGFFMTPYTGTLQEIIIYSTTLNTTQRQAVEFYLQQKWIQSSWQASYAGKSNTTTQRITFQNSSITINPNLYATTITAPTFTASMPKGGTFNGFFYGNGANVTNISDRRLKTDIRPIENALEKVSSMQAVRYRMYRDPGQLWIGYVAQDLEEILPEVVRTDDDGWKSIQYTTLPALIIEAVKELNEKYKKIKLLLSTV